MFHKVNRRKFLRYLVAGASTVSLETIIAACNKAATTIQDNNSITTTTIASSPTSQPTIGNTPQVVVNSTPKENGSKNTQVVVTRKGEPEELVRQAIDALGGMKQFVQSGKRVVIKPNICNAYNTYEYASTTNPWVVGTLVKLCFEAGASKVIVLDFPFGGELKDAYIKSGI